MKKILNKINETGTLLVEALAMLGLISMVTPVLYKKASERTVELQDINASSQLRAIGAAMDAFLTDNFAQIVRGETVNGVNFGQQFNLNQEQTSASFTINTLNDYLPYGMLDSDNKMRATKLFSKNYQASNPNWHDGDDPDDQYIDKSNYQIVVRLNQHLVDGQPTAQTLTGFIIARPRATAVDNTRAAKIASMIGSNGGFVDGSSVNGTQGIWSVAKNALDSDMPDNAIVISSLQPISSQGLSNEKVLYRVDMPNDQDQALNTMTTDLFMGNNATDDGNTRNIRMVNQIIMTPNVNRMAHANADPSHSSDGSAPAQELANALYIGNAGGANVEGELRAAMRQFVVTSNTNGPSLDMYMGEGNESDATFHVSDDNMAYGNPNGTMIFEVSDNSLRYKRRADNRNSLSVAEGNLSAMDNTLTVVRGTTTNEEDEITGSANDGHVTISPTGATAQRNASLSVYNWNWGTHVATQGNTANGGAALTVDGSTIVKDTLLGGKLKGFNVDAAKLRAGATDASLNASNNDNNFFMLTERTDEGSVFSLSDNDHAIGADGHNEVGSNGSLLYAKTGTNPGLTIDTTNYARGGIDIISGKTALLDANNDVTNSTHQTGEIRMGAENGIYLSTYNTEGTGYHNNTPVSIQGNMLQVYNHNANSETIDARVNKFYAVGTAGDANNSSYDIEGMEFTVGTIVTDNTYNNLGIHEIAATDRISGDDVKTRSILNIRPDNYGAAATITNSQNETVPSEYGKVTTRITGGVGIYDYDTNIDDNDRNNPNSAAHPAALFIDKDKFEIRATSGNTPAEDPNDTNIFHKGDLILAVDNNLSNHYGNNTANYGSIYIRKGGINIETNRTNRLSSNDIRDDYADNGGSIGNLAAQQNAKGYIAADRFISNYANDTDSNMIGKTYAIMADAGIATNAHRPYERYEVNPAYTSVMHDIKLTTRGGARLSDILPDFINKGIYVVDTSYKENAIGDWTIPFEVASKEHKNAAEAAMGEPVSAYVGFVPTPKCPPGYAKVITLTPAGWAMAQAGKIVKGAGGRPDISIYDGEAVYTTNSDVAAAATSSDTVDQSIYLDYQKSTWLRSEVRPVYNGKMNTSGDITSFNGWGLIMGFIYPTSLYGSLVPSSGFGDVHQTTGVTHGANAGTGTSGSGESVYWNLFPVYKSELEGYATVYCYFDRNSGSYDSNYVDKYNQLGYFNDEHTDTTNINNHVNSYRRDVSDEEIGSDPVPYNTRLNDPKLKYTDPW